MGEVGGGGGISGEVGFSVVDDGHLIFTLPGSARPNDVFDITIFTPNGSSSCTGAYSFTSFRAVSVSELVCDDGEDEEEEEVDKGLISWECFALVCEEFIHSLSLFQKNPTHPLGHR